jgi:Domain of unknown function (DUF6484)
MTMHDHSFEVFSGHSARTGQLIGLTDGGQPLVAIGSGDNAVVNAARTTVPLRLTDVGRDVLLVFDADRPNSPVVVGCLRDAGSASPTGLTIESDGETIVVSAEKTLKLVCGQASIRLSPAGKVEIRGTYILSRSIGPNKIKGGSVQLN